MSENGDDNSYQSDESLSELYHELYSYCSSTALAENGIHEIIERFGNQQLGKYEFFHAACRNDDVTVGIIRCLLGYFPAAVNEADDRDGCLPLHWACGNKIATLGLIELLVNANPDSVRHEDNNGFSPLHWLCANKDTHSDITEIIKCLLNYFPAAVNVSDDWERLPLTYACENSNVSLSTIQFLIDAAPDSIRCEDGNGRLPLHCLCYNKELDEATAIEILKLLIEKYPESIHHAGDDGQLPIHIAAAMMKSTEFCSVLIEAYPGSERIADHSGLLPFHCACTHNAVEIIDYLYNQYSDAIEQTAPGFYPGKHYLVRMLPIHCACINNTVETVEYLYNRYPDAINHEAEGFYPIHAAVSSVIDREDDPQAAAAIVKFLLDCDPRVKFQEARVPWARTVPTLVHAYLLRYTDTNIGVGLEITKVIYDADPDAIEHDSIASNHHRCHPQIRSFINSQLVYSRQAKDEHAMTTPDENGQLPLHKALQKNARLGSIKLLVKGNPLAVQTPDNDGALPLHVACMHELTSVVHYLVGLDTTTLDAADYYEGNTVLHYACRRAMYETISLLLEKYDAVSLSKRNAEGKLPIEVLCESDEVVDRDSIEYTECLFWHLRAYPETVMNIML